MGSPHVGTSDGFAAFWAAYPRHDAKKDARKAWDKLNPSPELVQQILAALAWQVLRAAWQEDNGKYVPLPASWLRGARWEDERRAGDRRMPIQWPVNDWTCPHEPRCGNRSTCAVVAAREPRGRAS